MYHFVSSPIINFFQLYRANIQESKDLSLLYHLCLLQWAISFTFFIPFIPFDPLVKMKKKNNGSSCLLIGWHQGQKELNDFFISRHEKS